MRRLILALTALLWGTMALAQLAPVYTEREVIPTNADLSSWVISSGGDVGSSLGGAEGKLRFFCKQSHLGYFDPIVNYGDPSGSHLHMFYGNTLTSSVSTYESLRLTGDGTCSGGPANRTAYWIPAMIDMRTMEVVKPRFFEFYYQYAPTERYLSETVPGEFTSSTCPPPPAVACPAYAARGFVPRGLALIAGINPSTGVARTGSSVSWRCLTEAGGTVETKSVLWDDDTPSNGLENCTTSDDGVDATTRVINAIITFQACWNGSDYSTITQSHVAGRTNNSAGANVCSQGFPYIFGQVIAFIQWDHSGPNDFRHWKLSSDFYNGATWRAGETMHADYIPAWDPNVANVIQEYIWALDGDQQNRTTNNGVLGDGTKLSEAHLPTTSTWLDASSRRQAMPQRHGSKGKIRARIR